MLGVGGRLLTKYEVFLEQGEIKKSLRLKSQARSVMSVISALGKPRKEDHKFEASLRYTVRPEVKSIKAETFLELDSKNGGTVPGTQQVPPAVSIRAGSKAV